MNTDYSIESLIAHRDGMCLIDKLLAWNHFWCKTQVKVSDSHLFITDDYLPAYVCIEYMAQTIAVLSGLRSRTKNEPVGVGFLLGTRAFHSNVDKIHVSTLLQVYIKEIFEEENGLSVIECRVFAPDIEITANINVYKPKNGGFLDI